MRTQHPDIRQSDVPLSAVRRRAACRWDADGDPTGGVRNPNVHPGNGRSNPPPPRPADPAQPAGPMQPMQPRGPAEPGDSEWMLWRSGRYRITPSDIIELKFPFVPELDQTLAVQPDGYVTAREIGDLRVQGRTLPQVRADLLEAYGKILRDPVFTVVLKEFEKPYFVVAGEITKPGRYDLRGATTLTQALAYAGGPTTKAKMSEVVIFRMHRRQRVGEAGERQRDVRQEEHERGSPSEARRCGLRLEERSREA